MVVVIVVARIAKVRRPAAGVREAFAAGHAVPGWVVVEADGGTVALRRRPRGVETLKAPQHRNKEKIWDWSTKDWDSHIQIDD